MSIGIILQIYVDTNAKSHASALLEAKGIEKAVKDVASAEGSFHGGTWLYANYDSEKYAVGGLFKFDRSLRAPQNVEMNGIIRDMRREIRHVVGGGNLLDVRAIVTDHLKWYGGESTSMAGSGRI